MIEHNATPKDVVLSAQSEPMSEHLVRLENLKALMRANQWNQSELARHVAKLPSQVSSWFQAGPNGRKIGEAIARELEQRLGLDRYALDSRPNVLNLEEPTPQLRGVSAVSRTLTTRLDEFPVLRWVDVPTMMKTLNATLRKKAPHLESFALTSDRAKFVEMPDDSMAPVFAAGDHVLLDPAETPRAGDIVLVRIASGELFVRTFRPRTSASFDAVALNPNYQTLSSVADGADAVAVMVEHRRYRHPR